MAQVLDQRSLWVNRRTCRDCCRVSRPRNKKSHSLSGHAELAGGPKWLLTTLRPGRSHGSRPAIRSSSRRVRVPWGRGLRCARRARRNERGLASLSPSWPSLSPWRRVFELDAVSLSPSVGACLRTARSTPRANAALCSDARSYSRASTEGGNARKRLGG